MWTVYEVFKRESLDTGVRVNGRPGKWNVIGGPFGMTRGRSTAVGIAQINDATATDIGDWIRRNDKGGYPKGFDPDNPHAWARKARYSLHDNIYMAMTLIYMDLSRHDCNLDKALKRWEAYTRWKDEIEEAVEDHIENGDDFLP